MRKREGKHKAFRISPQIIGVTYMAISESELVFHWYNDLSYCCTHPRMLEWRCSYLRDILLIKEYMRSHSVQTLVADRLYNGTIH